MKQSHSFPEPYQEMFIYDICEVNVPVYFVIGNASQVISQMAFHSKIKRLGGFTLSKYTWSKGAPLSGLGRSLSKPEDK